MKKFFKNAFLATAMLGTLSAYAVDPGTFSATVTPADGSEIEEGALVTLTYSKNIEQNTSCVTPITISPSDDASTLTAIDATPTFGTTDVTFNINTTYPAGTAIKVVVPAELVKDSESSALSEAQTFYYTLKAATSSEGDFGVTSWNPAAGSTLEYGKVVVVAFDVAEVNIVNAVSGTDVCLKNLRTESENWVNLDMFLDGVVEYNELGFEFKPAQDYQDGDRIQVTIPSGKVCDLSDSSKVNEEVSVEYIISGNGTPVVPTFPEATWNPVSGSKIELDSNVVLSFGQDIESSYFMQKVVILTNVTQGTEATTVRLSNGDEADQAQFVFAPEGAVAGDKIQVSIPAGTFYLQSDATVTSGDLTAEYTVAGAEAELTLKSITPAAGSELESIATNWTIELEGGDDVTELECTMTEKADSENVVGNFFITKGDDGFVKDMTDTFAEKMLKDVDYTLSIVCISYPSTGGREEVATLTVDYVGAAVVVDNISTIKISSVNPAANSVIGADNNKVTLEFTGAVEWISGYITESGQGAQKFDVTAVAANDAKTSYTIDLALENLQKINGGEFSLFMNWKDAEGKYVVFEKNDQYQGDYYNADTECRSTVCVLYQCFEGGKVVTVTPAAGEVTELYTFKLSYDGETPIALNGNVASIVLKDAAGKEVAKGASVKEENTSTEAGDTFSTWIEVTLDKKVTEVGTYTLVIPQDAIVIGDSTHGSYLYKGQTVEYTIKAQGSGVAQLLGEAGVADVYNLQGMLVVRGADAETVKALAPGIYIVNGKKVVVK